MERYSREDMVVTHSIYVDAIRGEGIEHRSRVKAYGECRFFDVKGIRNPGELDEFLVLDVEEVFMAVTPAVNTLGDT